MSFIPFQGDWDIEMWPKKASTAFTKDCIVSKTSGAGTVEPSVAATTNPLGINIKTIASTDSDYASNTLIPILVPRDNACTMIATVTGTLATTDPGTKFDLYDSVTVDKTATTTKILLCKKYISATQGVFQLSGYSGVGVQ